MNDLSPPEIDRILARAWSGSVPREEVELLERLPLEKRKKALRRLAAIVADEGSVADRAAWAGDTRTAFYRVRKAWEAENSVRSLTPYLDHAPKARGVYPVVEEWLAQEMERDPRLHSQAGVEALVRRIRAEVAGAPGASTLRRIVAEALRGAPSRKAFGRGFALEYVMTDLLATPALSGAGGAEWLDLAVLFETSTGLVLGWEVGSRISAPAIVRAAAGGDVDGLRARLPPGDTSTTPLRVRMPPDHAGSVVEAMNLYRGAADVLGEENLIRYQADFGSMMAGPIGFDLGGVRLHPRKTADVSNRSMGEGEGEPLRPLLDGLGARHRMASAVARHNLPIVAGLSDAGLLGPADGPGGPLEDLTRWA